MITSLRRSILVLSLGLATLAGCSGDSVSAPMAPQVESERLLGTVVDVLKSLTLVNGLQRNTALPASITVSKVIGAAGGTLAIPQAGVTVAVPAGALAANTTITMTAREGKLVAYDFAPHGITFAKPLVFTQNLTGINVGLLANLQLGYYADPSQLGSTTALVSELISGTLNLGNNTFTSGIRHFSGYVMSGGRTSVSTAAADE